MNDTKEKLKQALDEASKKRALNNQANKQLEKAEKEVRNSVNWIWKNNNVTSFNLFFEQLNISKWNWGTI